MTCTFIPLLLLNPFDFPTYSSNLRKRYRMRQLLMCLEALGGEFFCFYGRDWKGVSRKLLPLKKLYQWIWIWNLHQSLIVALLIVAVCTVLLQKLYTILRKEEPTRQEICNFFFENVQNFKILKMLENNMKFTREACWINSKISKKRTKTPYSWYSHFVTVVGYYYGRNIEGL